MNEYDTTLFEQRLGDAFDGIVAGELPSAVTVAGLVESGRRQVRRRRTRAAFGASVAMVMVTAIAVTIGVVAGSGPRGGALGVGQITAKPSASASVRTDLMVGTSTDPAAPIIAYGWLPPGHSGEFQISQDDTGASGLSVWGPGSEYISTFVQAPGVTPVAASNRVPAGDVQGHPAFWVMGAPGTAKAASAATLYLMWQYEPGAWASVMLSNAATSVANGEMLLEIARNLKIGPAHPVAMPYHLPTLPGGIRPDSVDVDLPHQQGSQTGSAALRLCIVSPCFQTGGLLIRQDSTTWMAGSSLGVDSAPQSPGGRAPTSGGTPVTVGGNAARLWTNASGATLSFTYGTATVAIEAAGKEYQALGGLDGFLAFCRAVTWYGADPAHWTTNVLG